MAKKIDRAAQFLPFDALKGLQEELRAREEKLSRVERRQLSDEMCAELSKVLQQIQRGSDIEVTFFYKGHYYDLIGTVADINSVYRYILVGEQKIFFDDIYTISLITI